MLLRVKTEWSAWVHWKSSVPGGNSFDNRSGGKVASWVAVQQDNVLSVK